MRVSDYLGIARRELTRQFVRSGLTVVALAISTVILVALAAISLGGRAAIVQQLAPDNSLDSIVVTSNKTAAGVSLFGNVQEANGNGAKLTDQTVSQLQGIPGVRSVSPRAQIWEFQNFSVAGVNKTFVAQAQGSNDSGSAPLSAGSGFSGDNAHEVILGKSYLNELGISAGSAIGKQVTITTQNGYRGAGADIPTSRATPAMLENFNDTPTELTATIVGISGSGSDETKLLIPMGWAHAVRTAQTSPTTSVDQLDQDGYSSVNVVTSNTAAVQPVATAIDHLGYGEVSTASIVDKLTQFSTIMWFILGAVALVALLAASLGIVNTMLMTVSEQRYVIGVWRACGARRGMIAAQFLYQAVILGLIGGGLGAAGGVLATRVVNQHIAVLLQAQHLPAVQIANVPPWLIAGSVALATIFAILAALYPAARAAREDPSRILHSL